MSKLLCIAVLLLLCLHELKLANNFILNCSLGLASGGNPFHNIEKTAVLQEARIFNETPVKARRCTHVLTKILYLLNQVSNSNLLNLLQCFTW